MKDVEEKVVNKDEIIIVVNEIKKLITEGNYKNDSIKGLKKDYLDKIKKLEEALLSYMGENDLKLWKTESPDKWK